MDSVSGSLFDFAAMLPSEKVPLSENSSPLQREEMRSPSVFFPNGGRNRGGKHQNQRKRLAAIVKRVAQKRKAQ